VLLALQQVKTLQLELQPRERQRQEVVSDQQPSWLRVHAKSSYHLEGRYAVEQGLTMMAPRVRRAR
jgi:hypothetical protein